MKKIDKVSRIKQYFLRGHQAWFALAFSILNFTLIFYNFFFLNLDMIPENLKNYTFFFLFFGSLYFPIATLIGVLDYKKGTYGAEQSLSAELSPVWVELFDRLNQIEKKL